jgi:hypothetical protein
MFPGMDSNSVPPECKTRPLRDFWGADPVSVQLCIVETLVTTGALLRNLGGSDVHYAIFCLY